MTPLYPNAIPPIDLYDITVASVTCPNIQNRLLNARSAVNNAYMDYICKAKLSQLHALQSCSRGKYNQIVISTLSKGELNSLYTVEMVGKNKPARKVYDKIMASAPYGKCPICGIGDVETLDHFAAKAYYPTFSVLSLNLAPACMSCNKGKSAPRINQDNQTLHPYFEPVEIYNDTWLHAKVIESHPPVVDFFTAPPDHWPEELRIRTRNHFLGFNLAKRYGIQAASEITAIVNYLSEIETSDSKREHLEKMARAESKIRKNSWRAALYGALSVNNWFVQTF